MPTRKVKIGKRELSLDARPDRTDLRDRPYQPPLIQLPAQWPTDADVQAWFPEYEHLILDQGVEGACTGFGLAAVINYQRFVRHKLGMDALPPNRVSAAMLYQLARMYDEWPGEDYEGSSCRGALKGWHRHGVCREALWPYKLDKKDRFVYTPPLEDARHREDPARNWDVDALGCTLGVYYRVDVKSVVDLQAAIRENGAVYVSGTVHEGWSVPTLKLPGSHADLARIEPVSAPESPGGHAYALVGYSPEGFVVQNSWGPGWGSHGFALLPYEDWLTHGDDAWVFTLGVPAQMPKEMGASRAPAGKGKMRVVALPLMARSPRFMVPGGGSGAPEALRRPRGVVGVEDGLLQRFGDLKKADNQPLTVEDAYKHTIILDRGYVVRNDITAENPAAALDAAAIQRPLEWLQARKSHKLMIYAHGGLNSERASITRIRMMAPYALANDIYPLFISWRSGPLETVGDMVEELAAKLGFGGGPSRGFMENLKDRARDGLDRMLEPVLRAPGGAMWSQMKLNAQRASADDSGGMAMLVQRLKALQAQLPKLEIHLVGHSAGSIMIGAMLQRLREHGLKAHTVRLMAPACTTAFALEHYVPAIKSGVIDPRHLHIHLLSDRNEQDDSVGPYGKSLLYLVSRSFEDMHKMPILGMAKCFDPAMAKDAAADDVWSPAGIQAVKDWQKFWYGLGVHQSNYWELRERDVSDGVHRSRASHGCFDNAVDIIGQALGYIVEPGSTRKVKVERLDY